MKALADRASDQPDDSELDYPPETSLSKLSRYLMKILRMQRVSHVAPLGIDDHP